MSEEQKSKMRRNLRNAIEAGIAKCHVETGVGLSAADVVGVIEVVKFEFLNSLECYDCLYDE